MIRVACDLPPYVVVTLSGIRSGNRIVRSP